MPYYERKKTREPTVSQLGISGALVSSCALKAREISREESSVKVAEFYDKREEDFAALMRKDLRIVVDPMGEDHTTEKR